MSKRVNGICKWFNEKRGFGFIEVPDHKDYFIHYTDIVCDGSFKTIAQGQRVRFTESIDADGRPRAMELEVLPEGVD